jgi:hypothetical protein
MRMYEVEVGVIKRVLSEELETQAKLKQRLYGDLFNKTKWLSMLPQVINEMNRNNYVSMAKLEVQSLFADLSDSLFADVIKLFSERVSWPILELSSTEAMKLHVLDAFDDAAEHAARLIVGRQRPSERRELPEAMKDSLLPGLENCLRLMTNLVPCCCETDAPRDLLDMAEDALMNSRLICGQPKAYHKETNHVSVTIPGRWFGRKDGEWLGEWDGAYFESQASSFTTNVFEHAERLLCGLHPRMYGVAKSSSSDMLTEGGPSQLRVKARLRATSVERLHAWVQHDRPGNQARRHLRQRKAMDNQDPTQRLLSSCFLCTQHLPQDYQGIGCVMRHLFGSAHRRERIDLCDECDEIKEPKHEMLY